MRVLHLDGSRGSRGGQRQLELLAKTPEHRVCSPRPGHIPYNWSSVLNTVKTWRPAVVAAHCAQSHQLALALTGTVPLVVHRRVDFRIRRRARWKYRVPDALVAVSWAVRDVLVEAGVAPERVVVVEDGVEPAILDGAPLEYDPGRPMVLAAGALVPHKGHRLLLEAAARVDVQLYIAGDGPLRDELRAFAGPNVHFLGQVPDLTPWMRASDVFCHPSLEEGMGQVLLEARAAGCRIVATRAGGIPEAVGPDAWLVRPGEVEPLADALEAVLQQPRPQPHLPEHLLADAMVRRTLQVYQAVRGCC